MKKTMHLMLIAIVIGSSSFAAGDVARMGHLHSAANHVIALDSSGSILEWPGNNFIPFAEKPEKKGLMKVSAGNGWIAISSGFGHFVGIKSDGTIWSYGTSTDGGLGLGAAVRLTSVPMQIGTSSEWQFVTAGDGYSIALKKDGSLWGWGHNYYGKINDDYQENLFDPVQIGSAADWQFVDAGNDHTLAIKKDGSLWAWGRNDSGQVGDGTQKHCGKPTKIMEGKHLRNVAGGNLNSLAVGEDGSLWGWGNNKSGQLSSSLPASVLVPRRLENGNEWVQADSSALYTFATKTDGTLWYWGGCGTVKGNLARQCLLQPVQIGIQGDWEKISAGEKHCSLLKKDGSVWIFNPDQGDVVPKLLGTLH